VKLPVISILLLGALACDSPVAPVSGDVPRDLAPFPWTTATWADVGRTCSTTSVAVPLPALALTALGANEAPDVQTIDDRYAALSRNVPGGFGGWFIRDSVPTIVLVDPSKRAQAVAALRAAGLTGIPTTAAVERGRWTFGELYDWYQLLNSRIGVLGLPMARDIQESANRIEYEVYSEQDRATLEELFIRMRIPCRLVAIYVSPYGPPVPR